MAKKLHITPLAKKALTPVQVRWMIHRDKPEVLRIEHQSFEFPWTEGDFLYCLRQRNCIGMVAEWRDQTVGFMVYELHNRRLGLLNFAVAPNFRRQGVGNQMIQKLKNKLPQQRRDEIFLKIRETNLAGQQFFRSQEFRAYALLQREYLDTDEDAFAMRYAAEEHGQSPFMYSRNRITKYYRRYDET